MFYVDPYTLKKLRDFEESRLSSPQALHRAQWRRRQEAAMRERRLAIVRWAGARTVHAAARLRIWASAAEPLGNALRPANADERREELHAVPPAEAAVAVEAVGRACHPLRPPVGALGHSHSGDADRLAG